MTINIVDNIRLKHLGISITKLCIEIVSSYKAIGQILEEKNSSSTGGIDNKINNKNAHKNADFSTYNITSMDTDASVGDTNDTNNMTKKISNNRNIDMDADASVSDISSTNNITKKVSNNTNTGISQISKIARANKSRLDRANKSRLSRATKGVINGAAKGKSGMINKGKISEANIKAKVWVSGSNKGKVDR